MEIVKVIYHREPDGWWADSPDVPGWSATAATLPELRPLVTEGLQFALNSDEIIQDAQLDSSVLLHGAIRGAFVTFDFTAGRVIEAAGFAGLLSRGDSPHWQMQPA